MTKTSINTRWKLALAPVVGIILNGCTSVPTNTLDARSTNDPFAALQANPVPMDAGAFNQLLTSPTTGATVCGVSLAKIEAAEQASLKFVKLDDAAQLYIFQDPKKGVVKMNDQQFQEFSTQITTQIQAGRPDCALGFANQKAVNDAVNAVMKQQGLHPQYH